MKKSAKWTKNDKIFLAALLPILVLFFAFNTLPLIKGFYYGLTNYRGYGSYDFIGLRNFKDLLSDTRVVKSYLFTIKYSVVLTIVVNVISLILALGLNRKMRCKSALRGIYFIPNILGGLVVGYIFSFIFTYILPTIGNVTGIGFLQNSMLASTKTAWLAIVIVGAWQGIAMNTIIYISGLQTVPEEVYEASMVDGARGMGKVLEDYFSAYHSILYYKSCFMYEKCDDGIRPDNVIDKGWTITEYGINIISYI